MMVAYKTWVKYGRDGWVAKRWRCEGWYLFGFLPIYVKKREC